MASRTAADPRQDNNRHPGETSIIVADLPKWHGAAAGKDCEVTRTSLTMKRVLLALTSVAAAMSLLKEGENPSLDALFIQAVAKSESK